MDFTPVIIIGAARSGTNILRDCLCRLPGFVTWDCDEINPVWRHGNIAALDDEFTVEHARPNVIAFVRRFFVQRWRRAGRPNYIVEKTCANSLRVQFVDKILPEARYIYIVRNGFDVSKSAAKRWQGKMEIPSIPYFWSKIRNTPLLDLPVYGFRFLTNRLKMIGHAENQMASWGPKFSNMEKMADSLSLIELCAHQWAISVKLSDEQLGRLSKSKWMKVHYEQVVADPEGQISAICKFLGAEIDPTIISKAVDTISSRSVGKGQAAIGDQLDLLTPILDDRLIAHGYKSETR